MKKVDALQWAKMLEDIERIHLVKYFEQPSRAVDSELFIVTAKFANALKWKLIDEACLSKNDIFTKLIREALKWLAYIIILIAKNPLQFCIITSLKRMFLIGVRMNSNLKS